MAEKRKTLPSTFSKAVASGDLDTMIAVFDKTDVNATAGRDGTNALGHALRPRSCCGGWSSTAPTRTKLKRHRRALAVDLPDGHIAPARETADAPLTR